MSRARVTLTGCFFLISLSAGFIAYILGMFTYHIKQDFGISNAKTGLINSIAMALLDGAGPLRLLCSKLLGCRNSSVFFGLLASISVIGASFTHNYYIFLLLIAVVCGFSSSVNQNTSYCVTAQVVRNQRQRQVAFGIVLAGIGVANVALPPLVTYFITEFTWRQAFFICGAVMLNLVPAGMLMPKKLVLNDVQEITEQSDATTKHLYQNFDYLILFPPLLVQPALCSAFFAFLSPLLLLNGFSHSEIGLAYVLLGVASLSARLLYVVVARFVTMPQAVWCFLNLCSVLSQTVLFVFVNNHTIALVCCFAFSFCACMGMSIFPSMVTFVVDDQHVHLALSIASCVYGIGGFSGPLFCGILADWLGNYTVPLSIIAAFVVFASVVLLFSMLIARVRGNKQDKQPLNRDVMNLPIATPLQGSVISLFNR